MPLTPFEHGAQYQTQIVALFRQQVFGARRVLFVKATLDDTGFFEALSRVDSVLGLIPRSERSKS